MKKSFRCHCEALSAEAISLFSTDSRSRLLRSARNDSLGEFFSKLLVVLRSLTLQSFSDGATLASRRAFLSVNKLVGQTFLSVNKQRYDNDKDRKQR
jgi:hypothetical protein